ncbi:MAG: TonB family protein [Bacteroidales bacterium]|nr:TonB family protein [Bacteroidales bacterium]
MKRLTLFICTLFIALSAGAQGYNDLFASEEAMSFRATADSLAALKGEDALADFVSRSLAGRGVDLYESSDYTSFGIRRESGDTTTFRNVIGWIPGYGRQLHTRYIVIGARLASNNASGLTVLLNLAEKLNTNKVLLQRSVIIAAFGGEEEACAGSWYFLNRAFPEVGRIDAYVNLDLFDNPNRGLYAYSASNADMNHIVNALATTLQPVRPEITTSEPASSDHRSFYAKEIPSIFFTTAEPGKIYRSGTDAMEYDEMSRQCEYLYNFSLSLANGPAPRFKPDTDPSGTPLVAFGDCDTKPTFFGVSDPSFFLSRWVYVYLRYPQYAIDNGIRGRVLVSFVIDEKGKVRDVEVVKGVHPSLDNEAIRVIEASPDWKPGLMGGKPVRSQLSLYVEFKLKKAKK